jgi:hypothetical protein
MTKEEIIGVCIEQVQTKLVRLRSSMRELQQANADNTKSTAGDKHETARAMVHLEQEKLGNQLTIEEGIFNDLQRMEIQPCEQAQFGTLITTNKGMFLLGAPCGKVMLKTGFVFGVSMQSPLAKAMLGKKQGDKAVVNGNDFSIQSVE